MKLTLNPRVGLALMYASALTTTQADVLIDFGGVGGSAGAGMNQAVGVDTDFTNALGAPSTVNGNVFPVTNPQASGAAEGGYLIFNFYDRAFPPATPNGVAAFNANTAINALENDYIFLANGSDPAITVEICNIESVLTPNTAYTIYLWGQGDNANQGSAFVFDVADIANPSAGEEKQTADTGGTGTDFVVSYSFTTPETLPEALRFDWYRAFEGPASTTGFSGMQGLAIVGTTIEGSFDPGAPTALSANGQTVEVTTCAFPAASEQLGNFIATYAGLTCPDVPIAPGTPGVTYLSQDESVATVSSTGAVTAQGVGTTNIEVSFGGQSALVPVTVILGFPPAATPVHRYSFNNPTASTGPEAGVVEPDLITDDVIGARDGTVWRAQYDGAGMLNLETTDFSYVDLPNGLFTELYSQNGSFSIEWWANATRQGGSWQRFFAFGESTTTGAAVGLATGEHDETVPFPTGNGLDYFDIVAKRGNTSNMRIEVNDASGGSSLYVNDFGFPSNTTFHWAVSYDAECDMLILYQDGVAVASRMGLGENLTQINDVNNWIGRASWNGNATFDGSFDEVRFYTGVLNELEVATSFAGGPDSSELLPDPGDLESISLQAGPLLITKASPAEDSQLVTTANFSVAGDINVSAFTSVVYTSNDEGVVTVSDSGVMTAVGSGTTTIDVIYNYSGSVTSNTASVTVSVEDLSAVAVVGPTTLLIDGQALIPVAFAATADFDTLTGLDVTNTPDTTWSSDDEGVVTVSATGVVTPVDLGTATITVDYCGTIGTLLVSVEEVAVKTPVLEHHYTFNYPDGTTASSVPDSTGDKDGTVINGGFTYTGGAISLPGGVIAANTTTAPFVELPAGMISSLEGDNHTFEMWVSRTSANNWERLFSFGSSTQGAGLSGTGDEYLYLTAQMGATPAVPQAAYSTGGGTGGETVKVRDTLLFESGVQTHVVLTWDSGDGIAKLYIAGGLAGFAQIPAGSSLSNLNDINNWLGRAQWGDPLPAIVIDEFNIYSGIFDDEMVSSQFEDGPDTETMLEAPVTLSLGIRPGPGASEVTLFWPNTLTGVQLQSSATLLGPWPQVPGSDAPADVDGNFEFTVTRGQADFFRLEDGH